MQIDDSSLKVGQGLNWKENPAVKVTVYGCPDSAGKAKTASQTKTLSGEFWSSTGNPTELKEDFFGETKEANRTENTFRRTKDDGDWDSTKSLDETSGLRVRSGKLEYTGGSSGGVRTWARWFKGTDPIKRISQFDITVGGLNKEFGDFAIYCWDEKGTKFRVNRVDGGIATTEPDASGHWHCEFPSTATFPVQTHGLFLWVEMDESTKKTLTGIEITELN